MKLIKLIFVTSLILFLAACSSDEKVEFPEGLGVVDTERGSGNPARESDFVEVHYTGYLAESMTQFDSSIQRNRPFRFELGAGQVIPGWDKGLVGMRVGGKRTLTIAPELAYGERGAGDVIPGNATLVFDVEMINIIPRPTLWSFRESQLVETESGLKYFIRTKGDESTNAVVEGDALTIFYAGFFEDGEMFDTSLRNPAGFRFQTGTGLVIPGFEEGILGMFPGEERLLIIPAELGYGVEGVGDIIPPNTTLYFTVRLDEIR